jgi:hypothetical protein
MAVQAALHRRHAAWARRVAREATERRELRGQLERGMAAHEWDLEDWEWRPTWRPARGSAAAQPQIRATAAKATTKLTAAKDALGANRLLLAGLTRALADLESPQRLGELARDRALTDWYGAALADALLDRRAAGRGDDGGGCAAPHRDASHALVLGGGAGGVLGLLAAAAGARRVTVVERSPLAARAARQLVDANAAALGALDCRIKVAAAPVERCRSEQLRAPAAESGAAAADAGDDGGADRDSSICWLSGPPASVVVTDLAADPGLLTLGLAGALQAAAAAGLVAPGARLVPEGVRVRGALAAVRVAPAGAFELQPALGQFLWHPGVAPVQLDRCVCTY